MKENNFNSVSYKFRLKIFIFIIIYIDKVHSQKIPSNNNFSISLTGDDNVNYYLKEKKLKETYVCNQKTLVKINKILITSFRYQK